MKLNWFKTELEREGVVFISVHVRMRYSCISCEIVQKKNTFSANQIFYLLLRLHGQKTVYILERVEEEHAKLSLLEVKTEKISREYLEELQLCTRERGRESLFSNQFYQ